MRFVWKDGDYLKTPSLTKKELAWKFIADCRRTLLNKLHIFSEKESMTFSLFLDEMSFFLNRGDISRFDYEKRKFDYFVRNLSPRAIINGRRVERGDVFSLNDDYVSFIPHYTKMGTLLYVFGTNGKKKEKIECWVEGSFSKIKGFKYVGNVYSDESLAKMFGLKDKQITAIKKRKLERKKSC
jgi:hypothetical protein